MKVHIYTTINTSHFVAFTPFQYWLKWFVFFNDNLYNND